MGGLEHLPSAHGVFFNVTQFIKEVARNRHTPRAKKEVVTIQTFPARIVQNTSQRHKKRQINRQRIIAKAPSVVMLRLYILTYTA